VSPKQGLSPDAIYPIICYLAIVTSDDGKWDKHPEYLLEKTDLIQSGLEAFAALDHINHGRVIDYCAKWGVAVPKAWLEYHHAEMKALREMAADLEEQP
jgi:hypothetical protein